LKNDLYFILILRILNFFQINHLVFNYEYIKKDTFLKIIKYQILF